MLNLPLFSIFGAYHFVFEEALVDLPVPGLDLGADMLAVLPAGEEETPVQVVVVALVFGNLENLLLAGLSQVVNFLREAVNHLALKSNITKVFFSFF